MALPYDFGDGSQYDRTFFNQLEADLLYLLAGMGGGVVTSVFGRTGAVVATAGDYTAALVTNVPAGNIAAVTVQAALNELDTEKAPKANPFFTGTLQAEDILVTLSTSSVHLEGVTGNVLATGSGVFNGDMTIAGDIDMTGIASSVNTPFFNATNTGFAEHLVVGTDLIPNVSGGADIGSIPKQFKNVFLTQNAFIKWDAGDVAITHSANALAFTGATSGYTFDSIVKLTGGADGGAPTPQLNFGSYIDNAGNPSVSHLVLWSSAGDGVTNAYGFGISPSRLNYLVTNGSHNFIDLATPGTDIFSIAPTNVIARATTSINKNTAAPIADTTDVLKIVQADAAISRASIYAYGTLGALSFKRTNGTQAVPTATTTNDILGAFGGFGYETTTPGYTLGAPQIRFVATQAHTNAAQGNLISFFTTPNGAITNNERVRIDQSGFVSIGPALAPDSLLMINANTALPVAPPVNSIFHVVGADAIAPQTYLDSFGAQAPGYVTRYANGTLAAKTVPVAADILGFFGATGWTTAAFVTGAAIQFRANETWSTTARGSLIAFRTTPATTTAITDAVTIHGSAGMSIGSTVDPGANALSVASATASTVSTVGALTVVGGIGAGANSHIFGEIHADNGRVFAHSGIWVDNAGSQNFIGTLVAGNWDFWFSATGVASTVFNVEGGGAAALQGSGSIASKSFMRLPADITVTNSTVLTDAATYTVGAHPPADSFTGMAVYVTAGTTYHFDAYLPVTVSTAAQGVRAAISGVTMGGNVTAASATNIIYDGYAIDNNLIKGQANATALAAVVANTAVNATTGTVVRIHGTITVNAAGYIGVQFAQSAAAGATTVTVKRGAWFKVWRALT